MKIDVSGGSVAEMWLNGKIAEIVAYNEFDAFTTHLLWARVAHFSGLLDQNEYQREQDLVRELLEREIEREKTLREICLGMGSFIILNRSTITWLNKVDELHRRIDFTRSFSLPNQYTTA